MTPTALLRVGLALALSLVSRGLCTAQETTPLLRWVFPPVNGQMHYKLEREISTLSWDGIEMDHSVEFDTTWTVERVDDRGQWAQMNVTVDCEVDLPRDYEYRRELDREIESRPLRLIMWSSGEFRFLSRQKSSEPSTSEGRRPSTTESKPPRDLAPASWERIAYGLDERVVGEILRLCAVLPTAIERDEQSSTIALMPPFAVPARVVSMRGAADMEDGETRVIERTVTSTVAVREASHTANRPKRIDETKRNPDAEIGGDDENSWSPETDIDKERPRFVLDLRFTLLAVEKAEKGTIRFANGRVSRAEISYAAQQETFIDEVSQGICDIETTVRMTRMPPPAIDQ